MRKSVETSRRTRENGPTLFERDLRAEFDCNAGIQQQVLRLKKVIMKFEAHMNARVSLKLASNNKYHNCK